MDERRCLTEGPKYDRTLVPETLPFQVISYLLLIRAIVAPFLPPRASGMISIEENAEVIAIRTGPEGYDLTLSLELSELLSLGGLRWSRTFHPILL